MSEKIEIKIEGHLDKEWEEWFDGMEIYYEENITILCGQYKDEAYFYGILDQLRDLNLKLISARVIKHK